jgi:hypothetical protein
METTPDEQDRRARRGARHCLPPLGLLAVAFVLPTFQSCLGPISPLRFGLIAPCSFTFISIWPLFLLAAALAAMTLLRNRTRAVLAIPALTWLASVWPAVAAVRTTAAPPNNEDLIAAVAGLFALPLSIASFARALRAAGWTRWRHAMTSFAAAAWLTFPAQHIFGLLLDGKFRGLACGAYAIAAAMIWLSVAAAAPPRG